MFDYSKFDGKSTRYVTLCVAEYCNLKCTYCYENHKQFKTMDKLVAKKIIDKEFGDLSDDECICLDFFGGEPFLGFETIRFVDAYLKEKYADRNYILFTTTNGTLVHGEIKHWLEERPYFVCGLSLDGNKYSHDLNRDKSFDRIDLDFFASHYPEQEVKMTVSQNTLAHLYENMVFCHEHGFLVSANLAFGIDWNCADNVAILEKQLMKLIDYYLQHPNIPPTSMLDFDITPVVGSQPSEQNCARKWCGTGETMHTYGADGELYACQFFMPISLGNEALTLEKMPLIPQIIPLEKYDDKCRSCKLINICPMCYGSNYALTRNFFSVDDGMCKMTKIIIKARSYFRARQLEAHQLDSLTLEERGRLIDAIMLIQNIQIV